LDFTRGEVQRELWELGAFDSLDESRRFYGQAADVCKSYYEICLRKARTEVGISFDFLAAKERMRRLPEDGLTLTSRILRIFPPVTGSAGLLDPRSKEGGPRSCMP
jgi:hypothetical protein